VPATTKLIASLRRGSFAVTVLFAAAAWLITYTVDRVTKTPTVEYEIEGMKEECDQDKPCKIITLSLENLSEVVFENVQMELILPDSISVFFGNSKITVIAPAWAPGTPPSTSKSVPIRFQQFHPGAKVQVTVHVSGSEDPVLLLKESKQAMKLVPASIATYFAKNDITFLTAAAVLLAGFVLAIVTGSLIVPVLVALIADGIIWIYFL